MSRMRLSFSSDKPTPPYILSAPPLKPVRPPIGVTAIFFSLQYLRMAEISFLSVGLRTTSGGCTRSSTIEELQARFTDERNHTSRIFFAPSEVQQLSEEKLNKTIAYIAEGARLCRERNIQFVVAFVPEKYRVYRNLRNVELASGTIRSWQVSSLPAEMGRRLADLGLCVDYLNLTQPLQEASQEGVATYFADDTHWTAAGNQLVAETLDRTLRFLPTRTQSTLQARNIEDSAQP